MTRRADRGLRIPDDVVAATAPDDLPLWYAGPLQREPAFDIASTPRPTRDGETRVPGRPLVVRSSNRSPDALLRELTW